MTGNDPTSRTDRARWLPDGQRRDALERIESSQGLGLEADTRLIAAGAALVASGLTRARSGNLSCRLRGGIRISSAGARLGQLVRGELVWIDLNGRPVKDSASQPSSEAPLHAAIYRSRPDVGAIVHTHSRYATIWSTLGESLPLTLEEAVYYEMGSTAPVVAHSRLSSQSTSAQAACALGPRGRVLLLASHGALAVAPTIEDAVDIAHSLEHQASVAYLGRAVRT